MRASHSWESKARPESARVSSERACSHCRDYPGDSRTATALRLDAMTRDCLPALPPAAPASAPSPHCDCSLAKGDACTTQSAGQKSPILKVQVINRESENLARPKPGHRSNRKD